MFPLPFLASMSMFFNELVKVSKSLLCATAAHEDDDEGVENLVQLVFFVKAGAHYVVHGRLAHAVHDCIIQVITEEPMLYALAHELLRTGRLLGTVGTEELQYALVLLHFGEEQRVD